MSPVLKGVCETLKIHQLKASVYHSQMDGLVERFNQTLKAMIKMNIQGNIKKWKLSISPLMFTIQEVPQTSLGCSPFELIYGHKSRALLDLI